MNLVSVIIPYFKKKKFFRETLNSVINQTFKPIEIIIIYDDSDKNDLDFIKDIIKNNNSITLIVNNRNLGAGISRNVGISKANGQYIAFIDADDIWDKNKISNQVDYMEKKKLLITHTSYSVVDENNKNIIGIRNAKDFNNVEDLIKSCDIGLSTVVINKQILKDNNLKFPTLKTKEDFVLWLMILQLNYSIIGIRSNLSIWRKSKNSLSDSSLQKIIDGYRVYNKYMKYNPLKSLYYLIILSFNYLMK